MKSNFKKFMGIILAMLLVVTMLPVTAFAENSVTPADSPDYVKTADGALELLYNGETITGTDGKTYVGFTIAKDYAGSSKRMGAGFQKVTTDAAGNTIPDTTVYGQYKFCAPNPFTYGDSIDVVKNDLPSDFQNNLLLNTWAAGSTYWLGSSSHVAGKSLTYISLPTGENMARHSAYLTAQMNDNANPWDSGTVYKAAIVRDTSYIYACGLYDPAQSKVVNSNLASAYAWGSVFPVFYVSLDAFIEVKMDVATMGANVKALLAENFIQEDFLDLGYTAEDFAAMDIPVVPANPKPMHSPNYMKVVTTDGTMTEFLYNDTITHNGKTYIGLVGASSPITHESGAYGLRFDKTKTDYEGVDVPTSADGKTIYVKTAVTYKDNTNQTEIHTNSLSTLPVGVQDALLKYTYDCGSNKQYYGDWATMTNIKTIGKLTALSIEEIQTHILYLASLTDKTAIASRTGHGGYGYYRYKIADGTWVKENTYEYPNGAAFMRMYVDLDMFKTVKIDVDSMRSNVKAMLKANFVRSDLEGIYSDAELDKLGVESFTVEEKPDAVTGSSFVAGGKTFYYLNNTIDYNGKKYFRVFDKKDWTPWTGTAFYPITERAEGGVYVAVKQGSLTGSELQNHTTNFSIFGDNLIPSGYEWSYGDATYNGSSTKVYMKGSVNVPSVADYNYVINQGVSFTAQGQQRITSEFFIHNNGTNRHNFNGNTQNNESLDHKTDGNYWVGTHAAGYNYVTYVSEDYFINNELDLATTGEVMIQAIKDNFTREELVAGGWSEAALSALFDASYTGTGLGLVAYKTGDASVAVVINNNDYAASTGAKLVVVVAYSVDGLEDAKVVPVTGTIPANAYTSKLPVTLEVGEAEIVEIKVMLWENIDNIKPLAGAVTLD